MAKSQGQKRKLLYLMQIFLEQTDEWHPLTLHQLQEQLESQGIRVERKTLYDDIEELRAFGMEIIRQPRPVAYYLAGRLFEMPELRLLVDAVQSSRFITDRKSRQLIGKVESLASRFQAQELQRQVYVTGRIKTMNESIYYNIDGLHDAIARQKQVSFRYFEWVLDREQGRLCRQYRRGGRRYRVSPWALAWDDENYYLVAYDSDAQKIKHYRVDKMAEIQAEELSRQGLGHFRQFDMAQYSRRMFGMYGGEEVDVTLQFEDRLAGVVADRFGRETAMRPQGAGYFTITVPVAVSPPFFAWVFGLGTGAQILGPQPVVERFRQHMEQIWAQYGHSDNRKEE